MSLIVRGTVVFEKRLGNRKMESFQICASRLGPILQVVEITVPMGCEPSEFFLHNLKQLLHIES